MKPAKIDWQVASTTALENHQQSRRLYFFSETLPESARNLRHVYSPVEKHGVIFEGDAPWEEAVGSFCSTIIRLENGGYRLYYSVRSRGEKGGRRMAVAESDDGVTWKRTLLGQDQWEGRDTNRIVLAGIPGDKNNNRQDYVAQPQVLRLADGRWRMYYWHHQHGWGQGPEPYTVAESEDGLHWHVPAFHRPALNKHTVHQDAKRDPASVSEEYLLREKQRRTNDANYVYWSPRSGCYEQFSQYFLKARRERRVERDNNPDYNRMIQRRVSSDGLTWSSPELVVQADNRDPLDQQFYYLSVQYHEDWLIGSIGHYRTAEQVMDLELAFSRDGRSWERPLRGGWIPRDPDGRDAGMIQGPNAWIDQGDHWLCLYTGNVRKHNQSNRKDIPPSCIMAATWAKHRFVGLRAERVPGGFLTPVFFPHSAEITLDGDIRGWLRGELCDAWGRKREGYGFDNSIVIHGDNSDHVLRWHDHSSREFCYDPVRLRLEFADADVYGVSF